ncbi:hypothetical protein CD800_24000 [Pseudomonas aeruginosa]|nr:hypothetical protein CD800_24000 [Pseudomonas aeruginosa]
MKQMTFADAEYAGKRKQTRKELFLIEMDQVVPWKNYLTPISRQTPISNYQELLMFFDQEEIGSNERVAIIERIRRLWSKRQFNERSTDKKQVNVMLSKAVIAQLDALAEKHGLKRAQVIESLIRMEADAGMYLAES